MNVYRVYVIKQRPGGSEVQEASRTDTHYFDAAKAGFWACFFDDRFRSPEYLLLMTKNNKQIHSYRFLSKFGERDYMSGDEVLHDI